MEQEKQRGGERGEERGGSLLKQEEMDSEDSEWGGG